LFEAQLQPKIGFISMSSIKFTKSERLDLEKLHKKEHERRFADRIKTILLLDEGWNYMQIAKILLLDDQTVRNYEQRFLNDGISGLLSDNHKGGFSKLSSEQESELKEHIIAHHYHDSKALIEYIKNTYRLDYSTTGMLDLLHRLGFIYKKPKVIPGKADAEKQQEFLDNELQPAIDKASDKAPLYFADGVHPTHNVQPQYGWILKGTDKEIRSNTGRQRININVALCYHTMDVIYREDPTINHFSTLNLLEQVRVAHDARIPIRVVLDNAPYNKVLEVREYAAANNINLMFLPSYSPNLNLIERLWRLFKGEICTRYYEKFAQFRNAVLGFLENIEKHKDELSSLITDNFQIIGN
jgi:transposase